MSEPDALMYAQPLLQVAWILTGNRTTQFVQLLNYDRTCGRCIMSFSQGTPSNQYGGIIGFYPQEMSGLSPNRLHTFSAHETTHAIDLSRKVFTLDERLWLEKVRSQILLLHGIGALRDTYSVWYDPQDGASTADYQSNYYWRLGQAVLKDPDLYLPADNPNSSQFRDQIKGFGNSYSDYQALLLGKAIVDHYIDFYQASPSVQLHQVYSFIIVQMANEVFAEAMSNPLTGYRTAYATDKAAWELEEQYWAVVRGGLASPEFIDMLTMRQLVATLDIDSPHPPYRVVTGSN